MLFERLWLDARLATLDPARPGLGVIEDGAIGTRDGRIAFVGPRSELPTGADAAASCDLAGRWITPGLVDCHTHLVYAGDRAHEFELRLEGATYADIAAAGGGIVSTVQATRAADEAALTAATLPRLDALIAEGVTTVEVKSGYGLDLATERRMLRVARRLPEQRPVGVVTTFLGAHALPPEAEGDKDAYIDRVAREMLPAIAAEGLADAVDAFCEGIAFSPEQTGARLQGRPRTGPAGAPARRPALGHRRSRAGGELRRPLGRPPRAHERGRRRGDGGGRLGRGAAARRLLLPARHPCPAGRGLPPSPRAHGRGDGLQPRHLAPHLPVAGDEHGRDPVPPDRGRVPGRRHARGGAGARAAGRDRDARSRASGATSPSGTSSAWPSCPTGWASTRCTRGCGGGDERNHHPRPGEVPLAAWRAVYRGAAAALDGSARPRSRRAPRRWPPSSPAASRSMASTPASGASPRSASRPATSRRSSAASSSPTPAGMGEPLPPPSCGWCWR